MTNYEKLRATLREVFMLDKAELDFGIYRILNQKRQEIERFLDDDLLPQVRLVLGEHAGAGREQVQHELDKVLADLKAMGVPDPEVIPKVAELREKLAAFGDADSLENDIFSRLANFFARYYDNGDFISQRRYKRDVYSIPYEGEEVKLHWANHDQYYIKTAEYFRSYRFRLPASAGGKFVVFELVEATTEQNNNKLQGEQERRFALYPPDPLAVVNGELRLRFVYEPVPKTSKQTDLLRQAFATLEPLLPEPFAKALLAPIDPKAKNPVSLLEKHLTDYSARNTFDYFIHKDLKGFLGRELDFYIKNEVIYLDDLNTANEQETLRELSKVKALRTIGLKIVRFLAQLEDFQKKLWLKKKFVVESNYCFTLDKIPAALYPEIAANLDQTEEWVQLFVIDAIQADAVTEAFSRPVSVRFLEQNPHLLLDTAFFPEEFKLRLLAAVDNIADEVDGLLVHSENFQALSFLQERFKNQVDCVYIDPPYNTKKDGFPYKDNYLHSSWLSMMNDRLESGKNLLKDSGLLFSSIDTNEASRLRMLLDSHFDEENNLAELIWDLGSGTQAGHFTRSHEYIFAYTKDKGALENFTNSEGGTIKHGALKKISRQNPASEIEFPAGYEFEGLDAEFNGELGDSEKQYIINGPMVFKAGKLHKPVTLKAGWAMKNQVLSLMAGKETYDTKGQKVLRFFFNKQGMLWYEKERGKINPKTVISDVGGTKQGSSEVQSFFTPEQVGDSLNKLYPKSTKLLSSLLSLTESDSLIMDFFAGSGTTANTVINLNREDEDSERKYILVEMGQYFDTVTKPRVMKAAYSKTWKDGKPLGRSTGLSHAFQYLRLESYEDTLNNLLIPAEVRPKAQQLALDANPAFREEYMLGYMLDVESRHSLLNMEWFNAPFDCKLKITRQNEERETTVDLVETFNFLLGLVIEHHSAPKPGFRLVRGRSRATGEAVLVVWRDTRQHDHQALNDFLAASPHSPLRHAYATVYVNGSHTVPTMPGVPAAGTWQVRQIEEEFGKRMFAQTD